MTALQVRIAVEPDAGPLLDALQRLHVDIGSVNGNRLYPNAPDDMRLLAVHVVDLPALDKFRLDLSLELLDKPAAAALASRVAIVPLDLDTFLIIFRDVMAIES
jgi:hypothetical protein